MEFSFTENQTVPSDKFEKTVPADFSGLYVERDGNYVLNSEEGSVASAVKAIVGLDKSLRVARAEAQGLKGRAVDLAVLSEYGDSPETIVEGIQAKIDAIKAASKSKGGEDLERQVTKIKEDLQKVHNVELEVKTKRLEGLTGQLHELLVTSAATAALAEAKAIDVDLVLPHLNKQVKVSEEDGKFNVNVVDAAGDPRYSGTTGAPMTIKEAVAEMKATQKFELLFESEAHTGGGNNHTTNRSGQRPMGEPKTSLQKISGAIPRQRR